MSEAGAVLSIAVIRSGGVAGISRTGRLELPRRPPSGGQEESWIRTTHEALEQLRKLRTAGAPSTPALPRDAFTWSLEIDGEKHSVADALLTGPARTLAEHVITLPRRA